MIIFFGPAGSGKSTQGEIIANKYGWKWLSVGALLRERAQADAEMTEVMESGRLVNDEYVVEMMSEAIERAGVEVIVDGYPRDLRQIEMMEERGALRDVRGVIIFDGDRSELVGRLMLRGRKDDHDDAIQKRFGIFDEMIGQMLPLIERAGAPVATIDCIGTIEEVTERVEAQFGTWGIA